MKSRILNYEIRPIVTRIDGVEEDGFQITLLPKGVRQTKKVEDNIKALPLALLHRMAETGDRGFVVSDRTNRGCTVITRDSDEDFIRYDVRAWAESLGFGLSDSSPIKVDVDMSLPAGEVDVLIGLDEEEDSQLCVFFGADMEDFLLDAYRYLMAEYEGLYVYTPEKKSDEPYLYIFIEELDVYTKCLSFWETAHRELDKLKQHLQKWADKRGLSLTLNVRDLEVTAEDLIALSAARAEKEAALVLQARALLEKLGLRLEGEHPVNRIKALLSLFYSRGTMRWGPRLLDAFDRLDEIEDEDDDGWKDENEEDDEWEGA